MKASTSIVVRAADRSWPSLPPAGVDVWVWYALTLQPMTKRWGASFEPKLIEQDLHVSEVYAFAVVPTPAADGDAPPRPSVDAVRAALGWDR